MEHSWTPSAQEGPFNMRCRAVLSLIGSQPDARTMAISVALLPGRQSLSQALFHKDTRLEQSHECTWWADVDDGTQATI